MRKRTVQKTNMPDTNLILIMIMVLLAILIISVIYLHIRIKKLTRGNKGKSLEGHIAKILEEVEAQRFQNTEYDERLIELEEKSPGMISHIRMERFNPFADSGGNHSFSMALLDGQRNGVVITALYARDRTNIFAKNISDGKCQQDLSPEEQKCLQK